MAKFKILVIAHALANNVVASFGEVVEETQFTSNTDELVKQGFIELSDETETETIVDDVKVVEPIILEPVIVDDVIDEPKVVTPKVVKGKTTK